MGLDDDGELLLAGAGGVVALGLAVCGADEDGEGLVGGEVGEELCCC